jgi:hypothetical protein
MPVEQILQEEIDESKKLLEREHKEITYKRDLYQRIELLNWVPGNIKQPSIPNL